MLNPGQICFRKFKKYVYSFVAIRNELLCSSFNKKLNKIIVPTKISLIFINEIVEIVQEILLTCQRCHVFIESSRRIFCVKGHLNDCFIVFYAKWAFYWHNGTSFEYSVWASNKMSINTYESF